MESFKYLGLDVTQDPTGIKILQDNYINSILPVTYPKCRGSSDTAELTRDEVLQLKRLSGQMNWVASQTRPDLSYDVCVISNLGKQPKIKLMKAANRSLKKLKSQSLELCYPALGDPQKFEILAFSDATYASLGDGSSQGAFIIFVRGQNGLLAPIFWRSKKLVRVTKSPLASETSAASEAADAGLFIASMIADIFRKTKLPTVHCFTDNKSLVDSAMNTKMPTDRKLRVDVARIREMLENKEITLSWIDGQRQLANSLTKSGASTDLLLQTLRNCCFEHV